MALGIPKTDEQYASFRDESCAGFERWLEGPDGEELGPELGLLLDWKWTHAEDGRLDRLTKVELEEFLLEWCPRTLSVPGAQVAELPSVIALGVHYLADVGLLSSGDSPAQLADHARRLAGVFVEEMDNPEKCGMAKGLFNHLGIEDPAALSPEELQEAIDGFNELPEEDRIAITGGPGLRSEPMVIGPVAEPSDEALLASALRSPALQRFRDLADYLGDGKPLTKTGALKLADARALVERLDTGDELEFDLGDRVQQKRSARDLPNLDHWFWWASQTGAVRSVRGRAVAVQAWQKRVRQDPVSEARKAAEVVLTYGAASSYLVRGIGRMPEILDAAMAMLLSPLLIGPGPLEFTELVERLDDLTDLEDEWYRSTRATAHALAVALKVLERAGLIEQREVEKDRSAYGTEAVVGAKIMITPLGVVALVDELKRQGIEITTLPDPASMEFGDLIALVRSDGLLPEQWWQLVGGWLDGGPDRSLESDEVRDALASVPTAVLMLDATVPDHLRPSYARVLQEIVDGGTPQDEATAAALTALASLDPGVIDAMTPGVRDQVLVTMIAVTGTDGPEEAMESLASAGPERALELIKVAARFPGESSETMLSLVGDWYPDNKIAKAARKELFRLRSKLAGSRS